MSAGGRASSPPPVGSPARPAASRQLERRCRARPVGAARPRPSARGRAGRGRSGAGPGRAWCGARAAAWGCPERGRGGKAAGVQPGPAPPPGRGIPAGWSRARPPRRGGGPASRLRAPRGLPPAPSWAEAATSPAPGPGGRRTLPGRAWLCGSAPPCAPPASGPRVSAFHPGEGAVLAFRPRSSCFFLPDLITRFGAGAPSLGACFKPLLQLRCLGEAGSEGRSLQS